MSKPRERRSHHRPRHPGTGRSLCTLVLGVLLGLLPMIPARADGDAAETPTAALPEPPASLPGGYTIERRGALRFTYPTRASQLAETLEEATPEIWRQLEKRFGQALAPALDIRIAVNPEEMEALAGRPLPGYASGVAFPEDGLVLLSLTAPDTWLRPDMRQLLTHELAHVALHRATSGHDVPRWFTEGVAIDAAKERTIARIRTLWTGTVQRRLLRIEHLSRAFPSDHGKVDLAYAQSADFVRYMLDGQDERARFRRLIELLRAGERFEDAVPGAYNVSLGYLEREWRGQIQRRYGRWPSILIGLTGIWGLAALALVFGYVRTRRRHRATLAKWEAEETIEVPDATPTPQPTLVAQATPPPTPPRPAQPQPAGSAVDRLMERSAIVVERDPDVPTVQHEGRHHTLH